MNLKDWDIEEYLNELGVEYRPSGKNVGRNSVGITCLMCDDRHFHLNIDRNLKVFHCWRCNAGGNAIDLISMLEGLSKAEAYQQLHTILGATKTYEATNIEDIVQGIFAAKEEEILSPTERPSITLLPRYLVPLKNDPNKLYHQYLVRRRQFSWRDIQEWKVAYCTKGDYANYLVFPIEVGGELVSFVGRNIYSTGLRYKAASSEEARLRTTETLYMYDEYDKGDSIIICEGIFDALRLKSFGFKAVGVFTNSLSPEQIMLLLQKPPSAITILLDRGEMVATQRMKNALEPLLNVPVHTAQLQQYKDIGECADKQHIEEVLSVSNKEERGKGLHSDRYC